jgi:hypothetical protein
MPLNKPNSLFNAMGASLRTDQLNALSWSDELSKPAKQTKYVTREGLFRKVASEKVAFETEWGIWTMPRWEALTRSIQRQASSGKPSAVRLLSEMWKKFPPRTATDPLVFIITEADARL